MIESAVRAVAEVSCGGERWSDNKEERRLGGSKERRQWRWRRDSEASTAAVVAEP